MLSPVKQPNGLLACQTISKGALSADGPSPRGWGKPAMRASSAAVSLSPIMVTAWLLIGLDFAMRRMKVSSGADKQRRFGRYAQG